MQKKIVALAVAGLSTAAFAQTNVTIYGVADVSGQGYTMSAGKALPYATSNSAGKVASGSTFDLQNNSSLIGFKGTEDLGNGLKALFQAETTLNLTGGAAVATQTSNSAFGSLRDSYVGLNSKYGTALAGYLSTPYRSSLTSFDVLPGATGSGKAEQMMGSMRVGGVTRTTNYLALDSSIRATAIAYAMPTLYGFNGSIAYTGSNNNGQNNDSKTGIDNPSVSAASAPVQSAMSLNLGWTGYGVNVAGAFQQAKTNLQMDGFNTPFGNYTSYLVGVGYTGIAGLKASVVYNRNSLGINADSAYNNGANKLSNNQLYTGVSYRMGNWEPRLAATWTSSINGVESGQTGARQWVLNTGYYLSKRTQVYGLVSNLNNSMNQNYFGGQQLSNLKPTGGQNLFTYGMGVRTTF